MPWRRSKVTTMEIAKSNGWRGNGWSSRSRRWRQNVTCLWTFKEEQRRARTVIGVEQSHLYTSCIWHSRRYIKRQRTDEMLLDMKRGAHQIGRRLAAVDWTSIPARGDASVVIGVEVGQEIGIAARYSTKAKAIDANGHASENLVKGRTSSALPISCGWVARLRDVDCSPTPLLPSATT